MSTADESAKITATLNAGAGDAQSTTWVVMQFGASVRPSVAASVNLELALANFFQLTFMIVALRPSAEYQVVGIDDDLALAGLSLYLQGELLLVLQPAGGLEVHPLAPELPGLAEDSFEETAALLVAALEKRHELGVDVAERFRNSSVARSMELDIDEAILDAAITASDVEGEFEQDELDEMWNRVSTARAMISYTGYSQGG
jgi:hypothetical protein